MTREEIISMIANMFLKAVGVYKCCERHGKVEKLPLIKRDMIVCDYILTQIEKADKEKEVG